MSQHISIHRKDGSKINFNPDGNIWWVTNKSGGPCLGYVVNHVCNVTHIFGVNEYTKDKYLPVDKLILQYAKKLHIRKIRLEQTSHVKTDVGNKLIVKYAYINRDDFPRLLKRRKIKVIGENRNVVLLHKSDFEFHST